MNLDKRSCIANAKALLADPTPERLRYAALELRLCIEALTYEKLRSYSSMVPPTILRTWQPPQAVKALLAFEPEADQSFIIHVGAEEDYCKPSPNMRLLGKHSSLRLKWLRKHYNKLGQLLHAPSIDSVDPPNSEYLEHYLEEVISDLAEPVSSSILGGAFRETFSFECTLCKGRVVGNRKTILATRRATCFGPQCGAEYFATIPETGDPTFQLIATEFKCMAPNCKGIAVIENRRLDVGVSFSCPECGQKHKLVHRQWGYGPEDS